MTNEEIRSDAIRLGAVYVNMKTLQERALLAMYAHGLSGSKDIPNDLITALTALKLAEDSANAGR